jgi:hypothetical protein
MAKSCSCANLLLLTKEVSIKVLDLAPKYKWLTRMKLVMLENPSS